MKYNDKEMWILSEGTWYGAGAFFVSFGLVLFLKIPIEENSWYWGIILGIVFMLFGFYSNKKAKEEANK